MLRTHDLVHLAAQYRDRRVLTVYLHTSVADPAEQRVWEVELDHALEPLRERLAKADHDEHEEFYAAVAQLRSWLVTKRDTLRSPGVVLAVAPDEVLFATATATRVPNVAEWGFGLFLVPLLKDAALGTPSPLLVLDARSVRLCRFTPPRHLETVESLTARAETDVERRMGGGGGGSFHQGTRGGTASEDADRAMLVERDRIYSRAIEQALGIAGQDGWIVLGGTPRSIAAARAIVPANWQERVIALDHLDVHARDIEIMETASAAIAVGEGQRDREMVREIIEEFGARGRGVAGIEATRAMLERQSVADLILSEQFVSSHPREADDLLDQALGQGATVRQVHGDVATQIDAEGEGVVARLRYAITPTASPAPTAEAGS